MVTFQDVPPNIGHVSSFEDVAVSPGQGPPQAVPGNGYSRPSPAAFAAAAAAAAAAVASAAVATAQVRSPAGLGARRPSFGMPAQAQGHADVSPTSGSSQPAEGRRIPSHHNSGTSQASDPSLARRQPLPDFAQLCAQHPQMSGVLQRRYEQTRRLRELWAKGNLAPLGAVLAMPQDQAVVCDFARSILRQELAAVLNLDACQAVLPLVPDILTSKYEDFVVTAVRFAELLLEHFGDIIAETRQGCSNVPERQLDLAQEERLRKCNACFECFREIHRLLSEPAGPDPRLVSPSFSTSLASFLMRA